MRYVLRLRWESAKLDFSDLDRIVKESQGEMISINYHLKTGTRGLELLFKYKDTALQEMKKIENANLQKFEMTLERVPA